MGLWGDIKGIVTFGVAVAVAPIVLYENMTNPPHTRDQQCPQCRRSVSPCSTRFVEYGGKRSFTDGYWVEYQCSSCGHAFSKTWTAG